MTQTQIQWPGALGELQSIQPLLEAGAYERLRQQGATLEGLHQRLAGGQGLLSRFVEAKDAQQAAREAMGLLQRAGVSSYSVRVRGEAEYPPALLDAKHPVPVLYFQGHWDLAWQPSVAVVGTRKPSDEGRHQARELTRALVADEWAVISGLAEGIDTVAHETAISAGGATIGVLGTPLSTCYPKANEALQKRIASEFLVVSQVPILYYSEHDYRVNRRFFPERNLTMSALSRATIIVEAGETSGTLVQARGALEQGRPLLILDRCFDSGLEWPHRLQERGAQRVRGYEDIRGLLEPTRKDR